MLVTEDGAFWEHDGVDYEQLRESMEVNWERGEFVRGASTITQQLAKNLYLSPSKNPVRKLRELIITRRLEVELSKQRILELYLNVIEWGDGVWGAEAAARSYFRKSAAGVDPAGVGAAGGGHRQPPRPDAGTPDRAAPPPPADDHAADGRRDAAARGADTVPATTDPESLVPALPAEPLPEVLPGTPVVPEPPQPVKPCAVPPCR